jgi:hypothetical protein
VPRITRGYDIRVESAILSGLSTPNRGSETAGKEKAHFRGLFPGPQRVVLTRLSELRVLVRR